MSGEMVIRDFRTGDLVVALRCPFCDRPVKGHDRELDYHVSAVCPLAARWRELMATFEEVSEAEFAERLRHVRFATNQARFEHDCTMFVAGGELIGLAAAGQETHWYLRRAST